MPDRVSIIIPVYNNKAFLARSFKSVKEQDYPDIECIIVDDGSTDGTQDYCEELKRQNSNVVAFHQPNLRQGAARNNGIEHATGKYIFFLDSDDWIEKNTISRLVSLIKEYDAQIAVCSCFKQTSEGSIIKEEITKEEITVLNRYEAFKSYVFNTQYCNHSPCDKLYDISLFKNERFLENSYYEDLGSVYRFVSHADKIVHTNLQLYCYYDNLNSTMHKPFSEHEFDKVNLYHVLSDFFFKLNDFEKYKSFISEMDKLTVYSAINYIYRVYEQPVCDISDIMIRRVYDTRDICKQIKHTPGLRLKAIQRIISISPKLFANIWKLYLKLIKKGDA